ncbi:MAG: flagellar hook-associated protein FlgK [Bacillota bacterium]|jgi:flagellar hook-associated protein 1 FlgK
MRSTFSGLEIARSATVASQIALDVTGQNIANANTENYTRQVADLVAVNYNNATYKSALPYVRSGQGVTVSQISQMRDGFLDSRLRTANADYNYWNSGLLALQDIENVFEELENDGLHAMLGQFYNQLQSFSNNAGNAEHANIVRSAAEKVTQVLNQYAFQLSQIRSEQQGDLQIEVSSVNTLIDKINNVNTLIKDQTIRGSVTNEMLDMRNGYLDELSAYLDITVTAQSDGTVTISSTGGLDVLESKFSVIDDNSIIKIMVEGSPATEFIPKSGSFKGHLDILNGSGATIDEFHGLPYYNNAIDAFAQAFAGTLNSINTLDPSSPKPLFASKDGETITAANITISDDWRNDTRYIVTTTTSNTSANDNIIRMINAMDNDIDTAEYPNLSGTFEGFSRMLMSNIAVDVGYQKDMNAMSGSILDSISYQRESIMGVSINEETINMTKYEKAFQAAARIMTAMDEALDIIINKMGIVGR